MMKNKILITNDVFDIVSRVQQIDAKYRIYYNCVSKQYELYADSMVQLVIKSLDCRLIDKILETRIANAIEVVNKIQQHNDELERKKEKKVSELTQYKLQNAIKFLNKNIGDLPAFENI